MAGITVKDVNPHGKQRFILLFFLLYQRYKRERERRTNKGDKYVYIYIYIFALFIVLKHMGNQRYTVIKVISFLFNTG
jgi:dolichol kinase